MKLLYKHFEPRSTKYRDTELKAYIAYTVGNNVSDNMQSNIRRMAKKIVQGISRNNKLENLTLGYRKVVDIVQKKCIMKLTVPDKPLFTSSNCAGHIRDSGINLRMVPKVHSYDYALFCHWRC